jgi:hypothetical protein
MQECAPRPPRRHPAISTDAVIVNIVSSVGGSGPGRRDRFRTRTMTGCDNGRFPAQTDLIELP